MSRFKKTDKYVSEKCGCCGQSKTYLLSIDPGTVDILRAVARAILIKGINAIHPRKEMEVHGGYDYEAMILSGKMTSNMVGNLSRPRFHGLIAKIKGEAGNYCLTSKGARFLKGEEIHRYAIISKATGHQVGYWMPEKYQVELTDFSVDDLYWEGLDYDIKEGQVIKRIEKGPTDQKQLFIH